MKVEPCTLEGDVVRLEPLDHRQIDALMEAARDPEVSRWMTAPLAGEENMRRFVTEALRAQEAGSALPFATIERASGAVVGSTRFGAIERAHRRVEIGWTFIAPAWQRTRVNTEAKYLMLQHAFEEWGCRRVEFKTDALNVRSRAAILRLGATEEGLLRQHMVVGDGRVRDTVYFSILDAEWPSVGNRLREKLNVQY